MSLSAAPGGVIAATPRLMASIAERERALSPLKPIDSGIRLLLPSTDSLSELEHAVTSARRKKPAAKRLRSLMRRGKDSVQNGLTKKFFRLQYGGTVSGYLSRFFTSKGYLGRCPMTSLRR